MITVTSRSERGHLAEWDVVMFAIKHGMYVNKTAQIVLDGYRDQKRLVGGDANFAHYEQLEPVHEMHREYGLLARAEEHIRLAKPEGRSYRWWEGNFEEAPS